MLTADKAMAYHLKFVKQVKAQGCFESSKQYILSCEETNPPTNSKWDGLVKEIITHEHDK